MDAQMDKIERQVSRMLADENKREARAARVLGIVLQVLAAYRDNAAIVAAIKALTTGGK